MHWTLPTVHVRLTPFWLGSTAPGRSGLVEVSTSFPVDPVIAPGALSSIEHDSYLRTHRGLVTDDSSTRAHIVDEVDPAGWSGWLEYLDPLPDTAVHMVACETYVDVRVER